MTSVSTYQMGHSGCMQCRLWKRFTLSLNFQSFRMTTTLRIWEMFISREDNRMFLFNRSVVVKLHSFFLSFIHLIIRVSKVKWYFGCHVIVESELYSRQILITLFPDGWDWVVLALRTGMCGCVCQVSMCVWWYTCK